MFNNFCLSADIPVQGKVTEWVVPKQLQAYLEEKICLGPFHRVWKLQMDFH